MLIKDVKEKKEERHVYEGHGLTMQDMKLITEGKREERPKYQKFSRLSCIFFKKYLSSYFVYTGKMAVLYF